MLEREAAAETDLEKERAFKWICFLPQALLRAPRRGGNSGRGAVNKRFAAVANVYRETLVALWEIDMKVATEKEEKV